LIIDPQKRMKPEEGLKHRWITRNNLQSLFKAME
jgi:hypothetical protein